MGREIKTDVTLHGIPLIFWGNEQMTEGALYRPDEGDSIGATLAYDAYAIIRGGKIHRFYQVIGETSDLHTGGSGAVQ